MTSPVNFLSTWGRTIVSCGLAAAGAAVIGPQLNGKWLSEVCKSVETPGPMRFAVAMIGCLTVSPLIISAVSSVLKFEKAQPVATKKTAEEQLADIAILV